VLVEKPVGVTADDVRDILKACHRNGVQFMDGVMFMHSRRLERLRQVLDDGQSVGKLRRIVSAFTFRQPPGFFAQDIRTHSGLEPWGCLGDLGWYCIRLALWTMRWQMPVWASGRLLAEHGRPDSPGPVPSAMSGELLFPGGVSAGFYCSFLDETEQWAHFTGTCGGVEMADFVLPVAGEEAGFEVRQARFRVSGCDFRMDSCVRRHAVAEPSHGRADAQETNMFRTFAAEVLTGRLNPLWAEAALQTQAVMAACLESAQAEGRPVPPG
jgi:predicted dehydrogenase